MKKFVLTKRVAKHGSQRIICIPEMLKDELPQGTVIQVTIEVIKEAEQ